MTINRHKAPKVIFTIDRQKQADYFCYLAQEIYKDKFEKRGFVVLPYLKSEVTRTVYFPELTLPKKFWRFIKKSNKNFGELFPRQINNIVEKQLIIQQDLSSIRSQLKNYWRGLKLTKIPNVEVLVTPFGPGSSFYRVKNKLFLSFRCDRPIFDFTNSLSSALIQTPEPGIADRVASQKYLQKLGLGKFKKLEDINLNCFSPQEQLVLMTLITKIKLSTDEIAELLWGENEEKYSLWAITKLIQKIRNKIKKSGGDPLQIKTIYGQGYMI